MTDTETDSLIGGLENPSWCFVSHAPCLKSTQELCLAFQVSHYLLLILVGVDEPVLSFRFLSYFPGKYEWINPG